jgi:hypothetical protein
VKYLEIFIEELGRTMKNSLKKAGDMAESERSHHRRQYAIGLGYFKAVNGNLEHSQLSNGVIFIGLNMVLLSR